MSKKNGRVSPEEFVRIWQGAKSIADAAKKAGLSTGSAVGRAVIYRKKGIPLKKFPRGGHGYTIDYAALAILARSLSPKEPVT